jgi:DNA-binding transcriptional LysR family regulator
LLESGLRVKLLDRTTRAVKLTPAGSTFLLEARRILRLTESAALATWRIATGTASTVTVGFTAASAHDFVPRLLSLCASHLPHINIALKDMSSTEQLEGLLTGRIDVGLMRPPINRNEFKSLRVATERLVAALPSGDPRLEKASLTLTDFDQQKLIMYAQQGARYLHDMVTEMFQARGVSPIIVQEISQAHSMLALVRANIAAALVPESAMSLHFDNVHFRPVRTDPPEPVELFAVWRGGNENPALASFLELQLQEAESFPH